MWVLPVQPWQLWFLSRLLVSFQNNTKAPRPLQLFISPVLLNRVTKLGPEDIALNLFSPLSSLPKYFSPASELQNEVSMEMELCITQGAFRGHSRYWMGTACVAPK